MVASREELRGQSARYRVLLANGHAGARSIAGAALASAGFDVVEVDDGQAALRSLYRDRPDLAVLSAELDVYSGWQVLERIREVSEMPVLVLAERGDKADVLRGLHAGADEVVIGPCCIDELLVRAGALARRSNRDVSLALSGVFGDAHLNLDLDTRVVHLDSASLAVTPIEFRLLLAFMRHPNQVLSAQQLLEQAWDDHSSFRPERVKFAVARLRAKLTSDGSVDPITSIRGMGYRYQPLSA